MGAAPAPSPRRASPMMVIFFTVFLDLVGFGIIIPVLPFYAERFGASPFTVTALNASYSLMQFLFAPVWGRISDRIGRRPVILISVAMSGLAYLLFGLAGSLPMLFASRILAGIGNANIGTAQAYIADITTPQNRARGMGLIGMSFGLGFILGPAIGGAAASVGGSLAAGSTDALINQHSLPAFIAAGLGFFDLVLAAFLLPESRKGSAPPSERGQVSLGALRHAFSQPRVAALLGINFIAILGWSNMESTFGLLVERLFVHGPPGTLAAADEATRLTSISLVIVGVVGATVQGGLIGKLARRFGEASLLVTGLMLNAFVMPAMAYASSYAMFTPLLVLLAIGSGLTTPSLSSLLSRSASADEQGAALGLGQSLSSLARGVGPLFGGWLFQVFSHRAPYLAGGVALLIAAFIALTLLRNMSGTPSPSST